MIMKKFLSLVAGISLAASASAAGPWDFTATPEPGTVTELSEIKVEFPNWEDATINRKSDIVLTYNDSPVEAKVSQPYGANYFTVVLNEPATASGKYLLSIAESAITGFKDGYLTEEDCPVINIEYTIEAETPDVNKFAYTVDPEPGEVESVATVTLTFTDPTWNNVAFVDKTAITMTLNGETVKCNASQPIAGKRNRIQIKNPAENQSLPGEYVITIPAKNIRFRTLGYNQDTDEFNPEPIVLTYTVKGGETPDPGTDPDDPGTVTGTWGYTTTPEAGIVKELSEIKVTFPNLSEIEINHNDDITLSYNGNPVEASSKAPYGVNYFTVKLNEPATLAGKYVLTVNAGAIAGYGKPNADGEFELMEDNEAFTIEYTIEGQAPAQIDFTVAADPKDMAAVTKLDKVVVTFPNLDSVTVGEDWPAVLVDNTPLTVADYSAATEKNVVTVTIAKVIEGPADVQVLFPAGTVTGKKGEETGNNAEDIIINYSVLGGVEYDLTNLVLANATKTNDKGEISAEKQLTAFFFSSDTKGLVAAEGTEANVTIKQLDGDYERTAHLSKGFGLDQNLTYFMADFGSEPTFNGKYTITVAKGAFGDEQWASDPETGHANPEIVIEFTLVDGRDVDLNTIVAKVAPQAGTYESFDRIAAITVSFDEEMTPVEGAGATLVAEDGSINYNKTAEFTKADNGFAVTFPAPERAGSKENYIFSVLPGQFKNAQGLGNAEINIVYTVDTQSGVSAIEIDSEDAEIFTLSGNRVSGKTLVPGIYIINGAKVLVK